MMTAANARRPRRLVSLALLSLLLALGAAACAEGESSLETCERSADCSEVNNICYQNQCQHVDEPRACSEDADCLSNEFCDTDAGLCSTGGRPDADASDVTDVTDTPDVTDDIADADEDAPDTSVTPDVPTPDIRDTIPPIITSREPTDGQTEVALDASVVVSFSEPIVEAHLRDDQRFQLRDPSGQLVPSDVVWDEATLTATMTPDAPLQPWSMYTVELTANITDLAGISLTGTEPWTFSTTGSDVYAFYETIAQAYAPIVHLDVSDQTIDIPVAPDFDGDDRVVNNLDNASSGSFVPTIYYNVNETESHYFIHYVFYFPGWQLSAPSPKLPHAMGGALVVARKDAPGGLGSLDFFQTYSFGDPARLDTFFPDCSGGSTQPFCASPSTMRDIQIPRDHVIAAAAYTDAGDPRRVRLYVQPLNHAMCHFNYGNASGYCAHTPGAYAGSDHAVLNPHTGAGEPGRPDFTSHTGAYLLEPIIDPWWIERANRGTAQDAFYLQEGSFNYTAPSATQPPAAGVVVNLPRSLNTPSDGLSNNDGRFTPFAWEGREDLWGTGTWFLDPAYAVFQMIDVPGLDFVAQKYCFNLFFGVDRVDSAPACAHP